MKYIAFFIAIISATSLAPPSVASETSVNCVHDQLQLLGYDPGARDGRIDHHMIGAYAVLQNHRGADRLPVDLNYSKAVVICRLLGLEVDDLTVQWPSELDPYSLYTTSAFSNAWVRLFEDAASNAAWHLLERYNLVLSDSYTLIAVNSAVAGSLLAGREDGVILGPFEIARAYNAFCPPEVWVNGFAYNRVIVLCFRDLTSAPDAWDKRVINEIMLHEIFHIAQNQLTGFFDISDEETGRALQGPAWLAEGSAEFFAVSSSLEPLDIADYFKGQRAVLGRPTRTLGAYEMRDTRQNDLKRLYPQGLYAAYILAREHGDTTLVEFYDLIGRGTPWKAAFEQAFNQSVEVFYAEFPTK